MAPSGVDAALGARDQGIASPRGDLNSTRRVASL